MGSTVSVRTHDIRSLTGNTPGATSVAPGLFLPGEHCFFQEPVH